MNFKLNFDGCLPLDCKSQTSNNHLAWCLPNGIVLSLGNQGGKAHVSRTFSPRSACLKHSIVSRPSLEWHGPAARAMHSDGGAAAPPPSASSIKQGIVRRKRNTGLPMTFESLGSSAVIPAVQPYFWWYGLGQWLFKACAHATLGVTGWHMNPEIHMASSQRHQVSHGRGRKQCRLRVVCRRARLPSNRYHHSPRPE